MKEKTEKLKNIAIELHKLNPKLILTGGLALSLQDVNTRHEPADIDFCFLNPLETFFTPLDGMEIEATNHGNYSEDEWTRTEYKYDGVKIDIFCPADDWVDKFYVHRLLWEIPFLDKFDIINFKVQHSLDKSVSNTKHIKDVIHILVNN